MSDGSGSEGETYEVEKILDKKIVKGKTQYFIKWKGELKYFLHILSDQYVNWVQQRKHENVMIYLVNGSHVVPSICGPDDLSRV